MFAAYFDESGSPDERRGFLTVAGSVSSSQKWFRFKIQWNAIVKRHGVEVFHMNECASGTGQYAGWTTDQKRNLITDLSECFARHAKEAFAVTVLMESWQNINQEFQLAEMFGPPYAFCGRFCVSIVRSWKERRRISAPVEYYFENGAKHKGELINRLKKHDGIIAKFAGKESAQLQAADLIAWKNRRVVQDIINRPDSMMGDNLRRSLAPVSRVSRKFNVFDEKELLTFCRRHNVPPC